MDSVDIPERVKDVLAHLKSRVTLFSAPEHYMCSETQMRPEARYFLLTWLLQISEKMHLSSDTYYRSVSILDFFWASKPVVIDEIVLVCATALWMACKVEENGRLSVRDFVEVCDNLYDSLQFFDKEREILAARDVDLQAPLPIVSLRKHFDEARLDTSRLEAAEALLKAATFFYEMVSAPSSKIAAAAFSLTLHLTTDNRRLWTPILESYTAFSSLELHTGWFSSELYRGFSSFQQYTGFSTSELAPLVSQLAAVIVDVPPRKYWDAVLKKLSSIVSNIRRTLAQQLAELGFRVLHHAPTLFRLFLFHDSLL